MPFRSAVVCAIPVAAVVVTIGAPPAAMPHVASAVNGWLLLLTVGQIPAASLTLMYKGSKPEMPAALAIESIGPFTVPTKLDVMVTYIRVLYWPHGTEAPGVPDTIKHPLLPAAYSAGVWLNAYVNPEGKLVIESNFTVVIPSEEGTTKVKVWLKATLLSAHGTLEDVGETPEDTLPSGVHCADTFT
jgi:hypothetical protein